MVLLLTVVGLFLSLVISAPIPVPSQPTSPIFSMIAFHDGAQFRYNLVYFDGVDLKLRSDTNAFFGRINGAENWALNMPISSTENEQPVNINVVVDEDGKLTSTNNTDVEASSGFAITNSLLTFENSSSFVACSDEGYLGEYGIYIADANETSECSCPNNITGYEIVLKVQLDSTVNYNPQSNPILI
ncbi:uncharacterized protein RJT21DRAFT_80543 [Scheffersomyces amazonensis]|uniref:uncharacterized protein n=1 Tax=Scheffersomyces amazonensis TaxID=1078765 RepID=UPI00315D40C7